MGSVWIARHLQLDIDVAVKFMTAEAAASPDARSRFEREAKAAARLKSAHIVQVLDYGVEDDVLHIVMELLVGEDLATRLDRVGRLSLPEVARILGQACKGLTLAHEAGVVHRDLKPANIFLARDGHDEVVKLLDFGIAKGPAETGSGHSTGTGWLVGSPNYMSPEQIVDNKAVDWRSDIWALGVIAFECLTGQEPFPGKQVGAILVSIWSSPVPVPSHVAPDLGPEVDRFFQTALARSPAKRFQHALDFARVLYALADAESGHPASGVPPSFSSPPPRFASAPPRFSSPGSTGPMEPAVMAASPLPAPDRCRRRRLLPRLGVIQRGADVAAHGQCFPNAGRPEARREPQKSAALASGSRGSRGPGAGRSLRSSASATGRAASSQSAGRFGRCLDRARGRGWSGGTARNFAAVDRPGIRHRGS